MSEHDGTKLAEPAADLAPAAVPPAVRTGHFTPPGPTFKDWLEQAEYLAATPPGLGLPDELAGNPHAVIMRMQFAEALDIPLMVAVQDLYVVDNRVGMKAELIRGLMLRAGHQFSFPHADDRMCVMRLRRAERPKQELEVIWTIEEAEQAGLLSSAKTADYWREYTADCLLAAATRRMGRRHASDLTRGFGYGRDELALASASAPFAVNADMLRAQVAELVAEAHEATTLKALHATCRDAEARSMMGQVTDEAGPAAGETLRVYLLHRWDQLAKGTGADAQVALAGRPVAESAPVADADAPGPYEGDPAGWVHTDCGKCKTMSVLVNGDHDPGCELRVTKPKTKSRKGAPA